MAQKIIIVIMLCLVILAGVLVLVFSQGSCPRTSTCLQIQDCYDLHNPQKSLNDIMLFGCSDRAGWVCCPAAPTKTHMTLMTSPEDKTRLLPIGECGDSFGERISEGQLASLGLFPWMVLLSFKINGTNGMTDFLCGGTLISKKYVLTAAHCMNTEHGLPVSVRLGELDLLEDPDCEEYCADKVVDIDVEKVISHENYSKPYLKNDIALIRLGTNAPITSYIRPICMPFGLNVTGEEEKKYMLAGWGKVEDGSFNGSSSLLFTTVPSSKVSECSDAHELNVRPINELQLCAGGWAGSDACKGDSGGPLMDTVLDKNGTARTYQVGIVSFGAVPCGGEVPSVYTRVSSYLTWILSHLEP